MRIISESACGACHAKGLCSAAESVVKEVQVPTSATPLRKVGDKVEVVMRATMGHKAVALAYLAPLVLLIAAIVALSALGLEEFWVGLGAIAAVALYYLILWFMRSSLRNSYEFKIR